MTFSYWGYLLYIGIYQVWAIVCLPQVHRSCCLEFHCFPCPFSPLPRLLPPHYSCGRAVAATGGGPRRLLFHVLDCTGTGGSGASFVYLADGTARYTYNVMGRVRGPEGGGECWGD